MELHRYLQILRRQKWLVIEAVVIVAMVAGVLSSLRTPMYSASARILLRPNDPTEQLYPDGSMELFTDPDRFVAAQLDIIQSEGVARDAAKLVEGSTADELLGEVSAGQAGMSDMIDISGTSIDPERAAQVANAFAAAYVENRRLYAIAGLQRAVDDIDKRLAQLEKKIAEYDELIGDEGLDPTASPTPQNDVAGPDIAGPAQPEVAEPEGTGLDDGAAPTSENTLKAARYAAATQYESLFFRQQELQVDINLKRGGAELISEARTPAAPFSPNPERDAMLGGFLGLLLGLGVAFLREQWDDRVRDREEIEEATGLPVIAELPLDEGAEKHPESIPSRERPLAPISEAVRALRTSLAFLSVEAPLRRIVVTSPGPGEGKSLVAANLATAYAQAGFRTILVSSDLRRPRLDDVLAGPRRESPDSPAVPAVSPGLTGLVAGLTAPASGGNGTAGAGGAAAGNGKGPGAGAGGAPVAGGRSLAEVEAALVETAVPNLRFLPAGARPPNPAEILGARRTTAVLDHLSALADVVILDTPPALAVTDAAVLAAKADGVLVVAALGETHRGALARVGASFGEGATRLLGVVVNKVEPGRGYHGYYRYHDYYATETKAKRRFFGRRRAAAPKQAEEQLSLEPDLVTAARSRGNGSAKTPERSDA